jgi:hypothetical protein
VESVKSAAVDQKLKTLVTQTASIIQCFVENSAAVMVRNASTSMNNYRVQVMVGVDVHASTPEEASGLAIAAVRLAIEEDPLEPHPKPFWVSGIARTDGDSALPGFMVFKGILIE